MGSTAAWGNGTTANAIAAIEYANNMGTDIINNSWGGRHPSEHPHHV
jgi:hypothetical protein